MVSLIDYLNESLCQHISVDVISVLEKHGSYDGCNSQATKICQALATKTRNRNRQLVIVNFENDNIPNKFFNNVCIVITNVNIDRPDTSYDSYFIDKNFHDGIFENIQIYLSISLKDIIGSLSIDGDLYSCICHELMHAYEDWQLTKAGKGGLSRLFDNEYKNASNNLNKNKFVDFYKYFFHEPEKNAYISELREHILAKAKKLSIYDEESSKKLLEEVKETNIYRNYMGLVKYINQLSPDDTTIKDIMKLKDFDGMTQNKVIKKLKNDALKLKNKLEKVIAKTLSDCVDIIMPQHNIVFTP